MKQPQLRAPCLPTRPVGCLPGYCTAYRARPPLCCWRLLTVDDLQSI